MLNRTFAKFLFYAVALIILLWTASLTYSFVSNALPNVFWLVPLFSLVVFDGGMIAWLFVYLGYADGTSQRAIAIITCVFDLIGVGLMVISEIFLGGQSMVAAPENLGDAALWGIGIWTIANVAAVVAFHLSDPIARQRMALQSQRDKVFDQALTQLGEMVDDQASKLAGTLAARNYTALLQELAVDGNRDGRPDIYQQPSAMGRPQLSYTGGGEQPGATDPEAPLDWQRQQANRDRPRTIADTGIVFQFMSDGQPALSAAYGAGLTHHTDVGRAWLRALQERRHDGSLTASQFDQLYKRYNEGAEAAKNSRPQPPRS